jgi:microcystin-dependent protein
VNGLTLKDQALLFASSFSSEEGLAEFPIGAIIAWRSVSPPSGWAVCNGGNGTPDLRNKFVIGAGGSKSPGSADGTNAIWVTEAMYRRHRHRFIGGVTGAGAHNHVYSRTEYTTGGQTRTVAARTRNARGVYGSAALVPSTTSSTAEVSHSHTMRATVAVQGFPTTNSQGQVVDANGMPMDIRPLHDWVYFIMRVS